MNFIGEARSLASGDVTLVAGYLGCHVAALRAVIAVECAGKGFDSKGRPTILNEPHIFYRELGPGSKRDRAVADGLAYAKWGMRPYPKTSDARYVWLERAVAVDEAAALKSCSYGMGQCMGFNHKLCGFSTVHDFVEAMKQSEGAQLFAMARFIVSNKLQGHLRNHNWAAFAKGYNGSGYAKNAYDVKLAAAYAKRPASEKVTPPVPSAEQLAGIASSPPAPLAYPKTLHEPTAPESPAPLPPPTSWWRSLFSR